MNHIFYKGKYTEVPDEWNALTGKQYVRCMEVLLLQKGAMEEKQLRLLKIITGWGWWKIALMVKWFRWNPLRLIKEKISRLGAKKLDEFDEMLHRSYALAEAAETLTQFLFVDITLSKNILPYISKSGKIVRPGRRRYAGPADDLGNMKMNEFVYAEHYFQEWRKNNLIADLNSLIAVIYRPVIAGKPDFEEDPRIPFKVHICTKHEKIVATWPLPLRIAIAEMYGSMRRQKIEQNPRVFSEGEQESESLYGLWSVMRQVAKQGHLGNFNDVEETYVDTVLMELNESLAEADKMEEEMERIKG